MEQFKKIKDIIVIELLIQSYGNAYYENFSKRIFEIIHFKTL